MKKHKLSNLKIGRVSRDLGNIKRRRTARSSKASSCRLTVPLGSYENIAADLYIDSNFQRILEYTKSIDDDIVTVYIENTLRSKWLRVSDQDLDRATIQVRRYLRNILEVTAMPTSSFVWDTAMLINKVYLDTHDIFGNAY